MSEPQNPSDPIQNLDQHNSVLFAQLLFQLSNTAMVLMGKMTDPDSGKTVKDLNAAQLFIDQIEMLEAKTKGNLSGDEMALLKQTLMTLRMSFVEAVDALEKHGQKPPASGTPPAQPVPGEAAPAPGTTPAEEEHRKKFSKKY